MKSPRIIRTERYILTALILLSMGMHFCAWSNEKKASVGEIIKNINGEPVIPRMANVLYVQEFRDTNQDSGLSHNITLRVKEKLAEDGRLSIDPFPAESDLKLSGSIVSFQIQPLRFDRAGVVVQKRIRIIVSVKLVDMKNGKLIFYDNSIQSFTVFSETDPPISTEAEAVDRVVNDLALRVSRKVITGWYTEHMTSIEKGKRR